MKKRWITIFFTIAALALFGCGDGDSDNSQGGSSDTRQEKSWKGTQLLENETGKVINYSVAINNRGDIIVIWQQISSDGYNGIYANHYIAGVGWSGVKHVAVYNIDGYLPQVAMDEHGNAIAVWQEKDENTQTYNIAVSHYTPSDGWEFLFFLETDREDAQYPQVVMDKNGNAIAVWQQKDGSNSYKIYANRYVQGSGWIGKFLVGNRSGESTLPKIAMDENGNAIVVWELKINNKSTIWARKYDIGAGWRDFSIIGNSSSIKEYFQDISMNSIGNAVAVWKSDEPDGIFANFYDKNRGWKGPVQISRGNELIPKIAISDNNDAVTTWAQMTGVLGKQDLYVTHFKNNRWNSVPTLLEDKDGSVGISVDVGIDKNGNAIAVWDQFDGNEKSIYASLYTPQNGWEEAHLLENNNNKALAPKIAMNKNGDAIVVWKQKDNNNHWSLYANRYAE